MSQCVMDQTLCERGIRHSEQPYYDEHLEYIPVIWSWGYGSSSNGHLRSLSRFSIRKNDPICLHAGEGGSS